MEKCSGYGVRNLNAWRISFRISLLMEPLLLARPVVRKYLHAFGRGLPIMLSETEGEVSVDKRFDCYYCLDTKEFAFFEPDTDGFVGTKSCPHCV